MAFETVPGSPASEHLRSSAAWSVANLARQSDLFFAHYEHRRRLSSSQSWGEGAESDAGEWVGGVLPEPKYQAFRHDLLIASFHPGHRAKWTGHELCHALVGFAYQPGAPMLFHALGAWLAELLPVALWYFFDEAGLRKCRRHQGQGPLFQEHCGACELAALQGRDDTAREAAKFTREGKAFVKRELAAVRRSQREGIPYGTRYATIDLASDGLAYAHAHGPRLRAPEMERFVALFFGEQQGRHASLEALEARVLEVCQGLTDAKKVRPWKATRWDYAAQDVGYRLLTVRASAEGELGRELDKLIDGLAKRRTQAGLGRAITEYRQLARERGRKRGLKLPTPEDLFAVGYDLPQGLGRSVEQVDRGIASACPGTHQALGKESRALSAAFARVDVPERLPIGRRFASFLARTHGGPLADLARVEAAITHVAPRDQVTQALPFQEGILERVRLAPGAEVVRVTHDVLGTSGAALKRARSLARARFLGVVRTGPQDVDLLELPVELGRALLEVGSKPIARSQLTIDDEACDELLASGLLVPERYRVSPQ